MSGTKSKFFHSFQVIIFNNGYGPGCLIVPAGAEAGGEPLAADSNPEQIGRIVTQIVTEHMRDAVQPSES